MRTDLGIAPSRSTDPVRLGDAPTWTGAHTWTVTGTAFGITANNSGTGAGITATNSSTGATGAAINATNSGLGVAIAVSSTGNGQGIYVSAAGTAAAVVIGNSGTGGAINVTAGSSNFAGGMSATSGYFSGNLTIGSSGKFAMNAQVAAATVTGYGTPTGGARQSSFAAGSITLPNLAGVVAQLILDLKTFGFIAT